MSLIALAGGGNPQELRGIIAEEILEVNFANGATINDLNIGSAVGVRFVGPSTGGTVTLNGVVSRSIDNRSLKIYASVGATVVIAAEAAGSAPPNQFDFGLTLAPETGVQYAWSLASGEWVPSAGPGGVVPLASPLTTKGDLFGFAATNARVPVGADGTVLTADSTNPNGVSYKAAGGGSGLIFGQPNFVVPPLAATWNWTRNQGGAIVTSPYSAAVINIDYPAQGALAGANWPGNFGQAQASPTFTLTACIEAHIGIGGTDPWAGIYWRDSVAGLFQMLIIDMRTKPWALSSYRFTEAANNITSTYFANVAPFQSNPFTGVPVWLRAKRIAGGNVTLSYSCDGLGFNALAAADATNFVGTPNELGITVVNDAAAASQENFLNLYSWNVGA
jgi:hypothetical protein